MDCSAFCPALSETCKDSRAVVLRYFNQSFHLTLVNVPTPNPQLGFNFSLDILYVNREWKVGSVGHIHLRNETDFGRDPYGQGSGRDVQRWKDIWATVFPPKLLEDRECLVRLLKKRNPQTLQEDKCLRDFWFADMRYKLFDGKAAYALSRRDAAEEVLKTRQIRKKTNSVNGAEVGEEVDISWLIGTIKSMRTAICRSFENGPSL